MELRGRVAIVAAFFLSCACAFEPAPATAGDDAFAARPPHERVWSERLPDGRYATVYADGSAVLRTLRPRPATEFRLLPEALAPGRVANPALLDHAHVRAELLATRRRPYSPHRVVVVFRSDAAPAQDVVRVSLATLAARGGATGSSPSDAPRYTNDRATDAVLASLGVDEAERIGRAFDRGRLASLVAAARARSRAPLLDISSAFRLHVTGARVADAVARLARLATVAYVAPDWSVGNMLADAVPLRDDGVRAESDADAGAGARLPLNYGLRSSLSAFLNAPGDDAVGAYDEVATRYKQLPGAGEIVTNVSIGDVDDYRKDTRCSLSVLFNGPTTRLIGNQHYLDLPSMPLIPAYVSDTSGNLSGDAQACNEDAYDAEIGLDFSVMAPLPHDRQRLGAVGTKYTDLLGVAPGASYRLVVPAGLDDTANSDVVGALLGAALQAPSPNVITASLGFGFDSEGFPSRYEEDDALARATIATIVQGANIVVCLAANDGTRLLTNAAIGPSGGAAPTERALQVSDQTALSDVANTTVPSVDVDTGAIDVGATTLDDIFAVNPLMAGPDLAMQHAFATTRWTGNTEYASGFGSRVDIAAPGDGIIALQHDTTINHHEPRDVAVFIESGTSASAPQVAAAAAVVLQVARLTGHPFARATDVRSFLVDNAARVPDVPQVDVPSHVGPQLDLTRAVETLLARGGAPAQPAVPRTAVAFRQGGPFNLSPPPQLDNIFTENVDRRAIDLQDPQDPLTGKPSNEGANSYLTVAPDWEGVPATARFELTVAGHGGTVVSRRRATRLRAGDLLVRAGGTIPSTASQTVALVYRALVGNRVVARAPVQLTFGPVGATNDLVLAPVVPAAVTAGANATIPVRYDLRAYPHRVRPELLVSRPGRTNPVSGPLYVPVYRERLTGVQGTVNVPVSKLFGGGIYGIGIVLDATAGTLSDFAYVRVTPPNNVRAAAPLLAASPAATPGHSLELAPNGAFLLTYDVSNVPGATGARIEFADPGANYFGSRFTVDNPNGTLPDHDGLDTGARSSIEASGTKGTLSLDVAKAKLVAADTQNVRVFPLAGAAAVGEASDVSTITVDGVVPRSGAPITGYGIQTGGDTGILTTALSSVNGLNGTSSIETFDERTSAPRSIVALSGSEQFASFGNDVYGDDLAVVTEYVPTPLGSGRVAYPRVSNLTGFGSLEKPWEPPARPTASADFIAESAVHADTTGAFLYWDVFGSGGPYWAFSADMARHASSPLVSFANTPLRGFGITSFTGFDANGSVSKAYGAFDDLAADCTTNPETIVEADLKTSTATSFTASGEASGIAFAIDPTRPVAALVTICTKPLLHIIDLTSRTNLVTIPIEGGFAANVAVDSLNHRFLVEQSDALGFDNNASWRIAVYDETGHLISQTPPIFNFFGAFAVQAQPFQANGRLRTGFVAGDNIGGLSALEYEQLQPFSYVP